MLSEEKEDTDLDVVGEEKKTLTWMLSEEKEDTDLDVVGGERRL